MRLLNKRIESLENTIGKKSHVKPKGMVKIPHDDHHYWWPEDHEKYEELLPQWLDLKICGRQDLTEDESHEADALAEVIHEEMQVIVARQIEIMAPDVVTRRVNFDKLCQQITDRIEGRL